MNHHHPVSERATLARAAKHLMQNHGSRAVAVAARRAVFLEQCGEVVGADTWHKIGAFVHALETTGKLPPANSEKPIAVAKPPRPPERPEDANGNIVLQVWPRPRETQNAPAVG
jgi:hypothetical protein